MRAEVVLVAMIVASCSGGDAALPDEIVCTTQYRPSAESMEGAEERTFTVGRVDQAVAQGVGADFATMSIEVVYTGAAPDGSSVRSVVTDREGVEITTALYQTGDVGLQDIGFAGGHGFTGLHYVHHEQAMLQYFCDTG